MRILVTGGAGFIGSHVTDAYVAAGHDVLVLDALWEHGGGRREQVPAAARFVEMDIRDSDLKSVFADFRPEIVSHHAAQHSVAIGSRDPIYDAQVNVVGLLNVLQNAQQHGARKVIYASSGATFGTPDHLPMNESTPQRPESPYGITKMIGEQYLRFYQHEHGMDFTALRYGNVYGPRQDPNGEAGVIAIFIKKFLDHQPVRIDWDGEQTRDYVYVQDVAQANVAALTRGSAGCYCIGTNARTSVNSVYETIVQVAGFSVETVSAPKRPGDARDAQFDYSLAQKELGWSPKTPLPSGIRQTYDYFKEMLAATP